MTTNNKQTTEPIQTLEIAADTTISKMVAFYFDNQAVRVQPQTVYRLDQGGKRMYYTIDPDDAVTFYTSVTTLIRQTMPTSPYLITWIAQMGEEAAREYSEERAHYGTFLHIENSKLTVNGEYDLETLQAALAAYVEIEKGDPKWIQEWSDDLKKDVLAWAQFLIDYKVKPIAIEIILTHPDGYAGAIDLVCEMTIEEKAFIGERYKTGANAGQPKESKIEKRVLAILDMKSGKKGFWESHEVQLEAYRQMWNHTYGEERPIEKLYNWAPKDWTGKTPTYHLKDQTDSPNRSKFEHLVKIAAIERAKKDMRLVIPKGKIEINKGLQANIVDTDLASFVKENRMNAMEDTAIEMEEF